MLMVCVPFCNLRFFMLKFVVFIQFHFKLYLDIQHETTKKIFIYFQNSSLCRLQIQIQIFILFQNRNLIRYCLSLRTSSSDLTNSLPINRKLPPIFCRKTKPQAWIQTKSLSHVLCSELHPPLCDLISRKMFSMKLCLRCQGNLIKRSLVHQIRQEQIGLKRFPTSVTFHNKEYHYNMRYPIINGSNPQR